MNDTLQNALSLFVGAMTTVLLMAGNHYFGGHGMRDRRDDEDHPKHKHEREED